MNSVLGWLQLALSVLSVLILPLAYFVWSQVMQMRQNDLAHLEAALAALREEIKQARHSSNDRLDRIEQKLDQHLALHLDRSWPS